MLQRNKKNKEETRLNMLYKTADRVSASYNNCKKI